MGSRSLWSGLFGGALVLLGCGDDGGSTVGGGQMYTTRSSVSDGLAAAGDVIAAAGAGVFGVFPGTGAGKIADGWTVEYQKLLVTIGTVTLSDTSEGNVEVQSAVVVDLQGLSEVGDLVEHAAIATGPSSIDFSMPQADPTFRALSPSTYGYDASMMAAGGYAVYIEGTIEKQDGRSCTPGAPGTPSVCVPAPLVRFRWGLPHGVLYSGCVGVDPATADSGAVVLTFPALRWLYTAFVEDGAVPRLQAQWIADADLDHDGETTIDELKQAEAAKLFTRERGYNLAGASLSITTAYDFLREQVRSIGRASWGTCDRVSNL